MYKIELHLHTKYMSPCGHLEAPEIVEGYLAAGYDAVTVTDHYMRFAFKYNGIDPEDPGTDHLAAYLRSYELMREEGEKRGLRVYRGAEIRFDENDNDYLCFGWPESLLKNPDEIFRMGLEKFYPVAHEAGALLIQAHPYRTSCIPADPAFLDGVEVLNAHPRHDDLNAKAKEYAERFGLIQTAGSDCHQPPDIGRAGIYSETLPEDTYDLARLIRSGRYTNFGDDSLILEN